MLQSPQRVSNLSWKIVQHGALDIEQVATMGRSSCTCPYYASRQAATKSSLVLLPYGSLLSYDVEETFHPSPESAVLVIDEAHNLPDTLRAAGSLTVKLSDLQRVTRSLQAYKNQYLTRLSEHNRTQLSALIRWLEKLQGPQGLGKETMDRHFTSIEALKVEYQLHNFQTFKLQSWLSATQLVKKLKGFIDATVTEETASENASVSSAAAYLYSLPALLRAWNRPDAHMQVIWNQQARQLSLLCLDAAEIFADLRKSFRTILLAGGTLSPMDDLELQLCPQQPRGSCFTASYPHVIPPSSVKTWVISHDIGGSPLRYNNQHKMGLIDTTTRMLRELLQAVAVPGGVVIFLSSYAYLKAWQQHLHASSTMGRGGVATDTSTWMWESQTVRAEETLLAFQTHLQAAGTAVLICVLGGKLSEGVNFADATARLAIVVGMPYPNPTDPQLQATQQYLSSQAESPLVGDRYYQSLCWRSINQALGRCIRHKNDWASIVLMDERFSQDASRTMLPSWLSSPDSLMLLRKETSSLSSHLQTFYAEQTRQANGARRI